MSYNALERARTLLDQSRSNRWELHESARAELRDLANTLLKSTSFDLKQEFCRLTYQAMLETKTTRNAFGFLAALHIHFREICGPLFSEMSSFWVSKEAQEFGEEEVMA